MTKLYKSLLLSFLVFVSLTTTVNAAEDPSPGTAPAYIEKAIEAGKKSMNDGSNSSHYVFGGGRNASQYNAVPPVLDCSTFIHWAFNKGANINLVEDVESHPTGITTTTLLNGLDSKSNQKVSDLKRGDIVFFNTDGGSGKHVGIYLGKNMFLHQGTSTGTTISDITNSYWGPKFNGDVAYVTEGGKGVYPGSGADFSGSYNGEDNGDNNSEETSGRKYESPFLKRDVAINNTGVNTGEGPIGTEVGANFINKAEKVYQWFIKGAVILSALFLVYTSISVIWYFALLLRGGEAKLFTKATGLVADTSLKAKLNVLGLWVVSTLLVSFFLTGIHVDMMAFIYNLIYKSGIV